MKNFKFKIIIYFLFIAIFSVSFLINPKSSLASCSVGATFTPYGNQADGWYQGEGLTPVRINFVTSGCIGQSIQVSITQAIAGAADADISEINRKIINITSDIFAINLKAGETRCAQVLGSANDCTYYITIYGNTTFNTKGAPGGELNYDCRGLCWDRWQWIGDTSAPLVTQTLVPTNTTYIPLAPLPGLVNKKCPILDASGNSIMPDNNNCIDTQTSDANPYPFGDYLNIMIKLIIGLIAVGAVVMVFIGGIEYMTSEVISSKEHGKERIRNAILGLLLALGAYAILNTINPDLLKTDLGNIPNVPINVDVGNDIPQASVDGKYGNYTIGTDWTSLAGALTPLPVYATTRSSRPECAIVGQQDCTSTRGLNLAFLSEIHSYCPNVNTLTITGGTEYWLHSVTTTHGIQSPTVDLATSPTLDSCLSNGQPLVNMKRYPVSGGLYLYETTHWHVGR